MVLNLKKNDIDVGQRKIRKMKKYGSSYSSIAIIIAFGVICMGSSVIRSECVNVYSPVNTLYNDSSDVIFTSTNNEKLDFTLPILGGGVEIIDEEVIFTVGKSIMVMAIESGVVSDCGISLDGVKYIKISHSPNVYSIIENIDIIGVQKFDNVKGGQDIATCKAGDKVILKIFKNDIPLNNLIINQSKIVWQN